MKTQPLGPFLGINNRLPDFALHVETRYTKGDYVRDAVNVDLDNGGRFVRRPSLKLQVPMSGAHSLSPQANYLVRDSVLYAVTLPTYSETVFKVLASNAPLSWLTVGDDLYYANGTDAGRITSGIWHPLGLPTPSAPALLTIGGNLLPGWYQVGLSYSNSVTGEEGGISASSNFERTTLGGLRVTLPAATAGATHINVYLSAANGSVPMWLATLPVGTTFYDAIDLPTGRESNGRFEQPLPSGQLFMSNGRLCSIVNTASSGRVCIGAPWRHGYYVPVDAAGMGGYIDFQAPVSVAVENQAGTYIVADKTRWFPGGDLANVEAMVNDVLPYGAVPNTAFVFPDKTVVGWFGAKGVVFGDAQGQVTAVMSDAVEQAPPSSGLSTVIERDGYRRVVSCNWCVNLDTKAATRYVGWDLNSAALSFALKSDGIYELDTDSEVEWSVDLGRQNFDTEAFKHLPAVYLGVECVVPLTLRVQAPKDIDYSYEARSAGSDLQMQRVDVGKGLRANWFDLSLHGATTFTLASVSFAATPTARRI